MQELADNMARAVSSGRHLATSLCPDSMSQVGQGLAPFIRFHIDANARGAFDLLGKALIGY
jgi:hypothetical protein